VITVALTSQEPRARFPLTLELASRGLPKRSWAEINQVRTLSVERLKLASASQAELGQVLQGLREILGG